MTTSKISVTEGSGKNIATYSVSEDAVTKELQRVVLSDSTGAEVSLGTQLGSVTETAPATDTASSGLNGRLQRIAQRLTTLIGSTIAVSGTFWQATQPVSIADGSSVTLGSKADAKSTATDTTPITIMSVLKQISASIQAAASSLAGTLTVAAHAVTNAGTFAVQATIADGAATTLGSKADAKSSASDTTAITIMQVLKQISFSMQAAASSLAGTLTVASHAVTNAGTFAVQATLQAGTALIGQASASAETSTIYNGTTALTPSFAAIAVSSSGATTVVSLVSSKKIRVLAMQLVANGAVNVKWQSHVTPTDITGLAYLAANGGYVLPYNPLGWFQTVSGEALDINLSGSVAVGGSITYVAV